MQLTPLNLNFGASQRYVITPALTPTGTQFVIGPTPLTAGAAAGLNGDLFLHTTATGALVRQLTNFVATGGFAISPEVSPDGTKVIFAARPGAAGPLDLYTVKLDGTALTQITSTAAVSEGSPTWAPDVQRIAFVIGDEPAPNENIYLCDTTIPEDCGADSPIILKDGFESTSE